MSNNLPPPNNQNAIRKNRQIKSNRIFIAKNVDFAKNHQNKIVDFAKNGGILVICSRLRFGAQAGNRSRATLFLTAISSRSADLAHRVHWTLHLSGSAIRITFSCYALSEKSGRRARVCSLSPTFVPKIGKYVNKHGQK